MTADMLFVLALMIVVGSMLAFFLPIDMGLSRDLNINPSMLLMVLTRCLTPEEACGAIQWKVVFLLGGDSLSGAGDGKTRTALYLTN